MIVGHNGEHQFCSFCVYTYMCVCTYLTASKYDKSIYLNLIFTSQIVLHFFKYLGTLLLDLVLARSICCHFYVHFTGVSWVSAHGDIYFHHTLDGTHKITHTIWLCGLYTIGSTGPAVCKYTSTNRLLIPNIWRRKANDIPAAGQATQGAITLTVTILSAQRNIVFYEEALAIQFTSSQCE